MHPFQKKPKLYSTCWSRKLRAATRMTPRNQPSLNLDVASLRDSSEALAVAVHKLTRTTSC